MGFVHLAEGVEQEVLLVIGNADAGIGNGEGDFPPAAGYAAARRDAYLHPPFFGKLDRIAGQVSQDLVEPCLVADESLRQIVSHFETKIQSLALRCGHKDVESIF